MLNHQSIITTKEQNLQLETRKNWENLYPNNCSRIQSPLFDHLCF